MMYLKYYFLLINLAFLIHSKLSFSQYSSSSGFFFYILDPMNDFLLNDSAILTHFSSDTKYKCLAKCTKTFQCAYAALKQNKCFISKIDLTLFNNYGKNQNTLIYQKNFKFTKGLTNYWPFNLNLNDFIGEANLVNGVNGNLTVDRFGNLDSALSLENGYYEVPPGIYFGGTEFTIMVWVKIRNFNTNSRLIDFGIGPTNQNVVFSLNKLNSGNPYLFFYGDQDSGVDSGELVSTVPLNLNQWQHLACVYISPNYYIYINGVQTLDGVTSFVSINSVERNTNFIGHSNWGGTDQDADADLDDLKFFKRGLSQQEINFEMHNYL